MESSPADSKRRQVVSWIRMMRNSNSQIIVNNYSYRCRFSGFHTTKTLIVFPEEVQKKGIITIDKPLEEVELTDIISLHKKNWTRSCGD